MLAKIFGWGKTGKSDAGKKSAVDAVAPLPTIDEEGLRYASPAPLARQWLAAPYDYPAHAELGAHLALVVQEGFGVAVGSGVLLSWENVFGILSREELRAFRAPLRFPPDTLMRPRVMNAGALGDADFGLHIDEWVDAQGRGARPAPRLVGKVLRTGDTDALLPAAVSEMLDMLARFRATPVDARTLSLKEHIYGRVRALAAESGSPVSDYMASTIVLAPDHLRLEVERRGEGAAAVLEVSPGFEGAPGNWITHFDRLPLDDRYNIPEGPALVRVVPTPEVKAVLSEIKRSMPGRRVTGTRAQAFVRNPFATLGESAREVLDAGEFEAACEAAGIVFKAFVPQVERGERGEIERVGLLVQPLAASDEPAAMTWFTSPDELARFTGRLSRALDDGSQCTVWNDDELEIIGDTVEHVQVLSGWLREWLTPVLWTASEVLDLRHYSERIDEIGVEKAFAVPVIAKNREEGGWFEQNTSIGLRVDDPSGGTRYVPFEFGEIPSLQESVNAAQAAGADLMTLPGLVQPIPVSEAQRALEALARAAADVQRGTFPPRAAVLPSAKKRLIIKRNFEEIEYNEVRADALQMPPHHVPAIPQTLRPEVVLKPHQETGVAWLQHLWSLSPAACRGTVLADDMGLGKTLQLLTFIASCFEREPQLEPALIVAPVALLENWRNELARFFAPDTLPLLLLYGDTLKSLRASRQEIDESLAAQGVTRLLKRDWTGGARLVLTTYETMRDLEFAMARQSWSIMVCDEAQKIKNPAALVTRSAKKQKVRFRIACTGTPVENTLADLWCLFDFVQPGMLGALNHFSRTYRRPIEAKTEEQQARVNALRKVIQPQILHRKKTDVAKDLPVPVENKTCKQLPMSPYQQRNYENALATLRAQRESNPSAQLQALLAIRKICTDPHGFAEPDVRDVPITRLVDESPKMGWLVDTLKMLAADAPGRHKVIVFCEFRELQLVLQRVVAAMFGFAPSIVNGDTSADPRAIGNRQQLIDAFQASEGFDVIILSPLAVGFGVNIQAANHVIHFTRTWNPAKEDQATARAYRIGQTRTVTLYYPGVVSEVFPSFDVRLDALLQRKRELAADMLNGCSDITAADFADFG
ncbi:DEAD/DEAH box helicase [Caballeronia sp. LZ035]|uniref:DEAD/DEAH box helicase n=1 Tax=Caballeronia sp. LZ035 TaxID=3038568 RepID=UPI00285C268A|nr:DEAD/DEAH box helicase [Caballeronia sp. LZ035]MDR5761468.1 DEAD/DEAH box helicase [Caballeronia sp. LZ035]